MFKVFLLRNRGRRLAWRDVVNGPRYVGQLTTYAIDIDGERYQVASLRPSDSTQGALVPELYDPVLIGFSVP